MVSRMTIATSLSWPQPFLLEKVRAGASGQPSYTFLEEMGWRRYDAALATQAIDIGFHAKNYKATSRCSQLIGEWSAAVTAVVKRETTRRRICTRGAAQKDFAHFSTICLFTS